MPFSFSKCADLYFLISTVIAQLSNPITKLIISVGIPTKEIKPEIQIHPVTVKLR